MVPKANALSPESHETTNLVLPWWLLEDQQEALKCQELRSLLPIALLMTAAGTRLKRQVCDPNTIVVMAALLSSFNYSVHHRTLNDWYRETVPPHDHQRRNRPLIKLAHVVSPFLVKNNVPLEQQITFASMLRAQKDTHKATVHLYGAVSLEDKTAVPSDFELLPLLERSTQSEYPELKFDKKIPFVQDILSRLYANAPQADYMIYTNVDIGLQKHFYDAVVDLIDEGYDAFSITRRTIQSNVSGEYIGPDNLELAYQQEGKQHGGHDCFVFKRDLFASLSFGDIFLGYPCIGKVMVQLLKAHAQNFTVKRNEHLTFHLGNDRSYDSTDQSKFYKQNRVNCVDVLSKSQKVNKKLKRRWRESLKTFQNQTAVQQQK